MIGNGSDAWSLWAKNPQAARAWLVEMEAFPLAPSSGNAGSLGEPALGELALGELDSSISDIATTTIRFSSHGMTTGASETPANTHYPARIEAVRMDARIPGVTISGDAQVFAEIDLINSDGALDGLAEAYAFDGRTCNILVGDPSWPRTAGALPYFFTIFEGVVVQVDIQMSRVRLTLDSKLRLLDVPAQNSVYETAANSALLGLPKPLVFGKVRNITPVLLDPVDLVYQVHDGAINDVTAVYDRGVPLTKVTTSPGLGEYLVSAGNGTFQLGGAPAGEVTCDVTGQMGLSNLWWSVFRAIIEHTTFSVTPDNGDHLAMLIAFPGDGGLYVGPQQVTSLELLREVAEGAGAFFWADFGANIRVNHLYVSPAAPVITLDGTEVLEMERTPLAREFDPAVYRLAVGYDRNYTVQSDLADAVEASRIGDVALPERTFINEDLSTLSRRPLAKNISLSSHFITQDGARNLAQAMMSIWKTPRARLRLKTGFVGILLQLGDAVTLDLNRFGLSGGVAARVLRSSLDSSSDHSIELEVAITDPSFYVFEDIVLGF